MASEAEPVLVIVVASPIAVVSAALIAPATAASAAVHQVAECLGGTAVATRAAAPAVDPPAWVAVVTAAVAGEDLVAGDAVVVVVDAVVVAAGVSN